MKIGIDIDEVLANTIDLFIEFYNQTYGTSVKRNELTDYYFDGVFGWSKDENLKKFDEFYASEYFTRITPLPGAIDGVKSLKSGNSLYVITSRPSSLETATKTWLKQHFGSDLINIHFASVGTARKKSDICEELGIDIHIDDSLEFAIDCAVKKVNVLLMDAPWNRKPFGGCITRVQNWGQVLQYIEKVEKEKLPL